MECNEYAEDSVNSSEISYLAMIEYGTMVRYQNKTNNYPYTTQLQYNVEDALIVFEKKPRRFRLTDLGSLFLKS